MKSVAETALVLVRILLVGLGGLSMSVVAQPSDAQESVRKYVQDFYTWYGTISHKNSKLSPDQRAIRERGPCFSAKLITALKEDYRASAKNPEEVVGLDWDPFLCSQDLEDSYEVGAIRRRGEHYLVEVYGVSGGKKNKEPNVIAEVARSGGHWIFVNFHSPHGGDLLQDLRRLQEERRKSPE